MLCLAGAFILAVKTLLVGSDHGQCQGSWQVWGPTLPTSGAALPSRQAIKWRLAIQDAFSKPISDCVARKTVGCGDTTSGVCVLLETGALGL